MSIAVALLGQLEELSVEHGFERVESLSVEAGVLRGIVPEAFEMAFREASKGGVAEDAKLDLRIVPVKARCRGCDHEFESSVESYRCEQCGRADVELISGMDILLMSIEARGAEGEGT